MSKLWQVALNEYQRNVFKKSFLVALFSVPLMIGLNVGVVLIIEAVNTNTAPVGYIDHADAIGEDPLMPEVRNEKRAVEFWSYESEDAAKEALDSGEIQAFYVLSEDYFTTRQVELKYVKNPGENAERQFYDFLQLNLMSDLPEDIAYRVAGGSGVLLRQADGSRDFPASGPRLGDIVPAILSLAFVFLVMMSAGFMMQAVVDEKENRTMEVLLTSVSSNQLIAGKILGIVGISLTQLITWIAVAVLAIFLAGNVGGIAWFQNVEMQWANLIAMILIAVPSYVVASAVMVMIGSTVGAAQEGQSAAGMSSILYMIPLYTLRLIAENPDGTLSTVMSFLPYTSLLTFGVRTLIATVPLWQVIIAVLAQCLYATGAMWLAAKAFRLGVLRYGQRIKLKTLFAKENGVTKAVEREAAA